MATQCLSQPENSVITSLQHGPHSARRILVADDEQAMRLINTAVLTQVGYKVDAAEDGDAAWQALTANDYDLLITDHSMPKVSGVDLLRKLHAARMALPVIMATGTVPSHEFVREPWLQPVAVLLKPYTRAELLGTVEGVLRVTHGVQ
jgi:CheY-like chemotaxis protein